jgi:hypothetical protein
MSRVLIYTVLSGNPEGLHDPHMQCTRSKLQKESFEKVL